MATKYYRLNKKGDLEEIPYVQKSDGTYSMEALSNRLVNIYETLASQGENKVLSTYPTDAQTAMIKDFIFKHSKSGGRNSMDFITLNYNIDFHNIVSTAGDSLGASALALSSHVLFTNFDISIAENNTDEYKILESLDLTNMSKTKSNDSIPINDLLNVMITAFVDALKNPFILGANVNRQTLNPVLFMIRAGFGLKTFAFVLNKSIIDVSRAGGITPVALNYYKKILNLQGISTENDFTISDAFDYIKSNFIFEEGSESTTEEYKNLMTQDGLIEAIEEQELMYDDIDWLKKQLAILYTFSTFRSAGTKISTATKLHNLYSNSNTSSFYNIVEFLETEKSNRESLEEYFNGYNELFSDEFIFKPQIDAVQDLLDKLDRTGMIELSDTAWNVYDYVNRYIPSRVNTIGRRNVFKQAIRGLKLYMSVNFAKNVMDSMGITPGKLVSEISTKLSMIKSIDDDNIKQNVLLSSLYNQVYEGKIITKYNNMLAKDESTKDALYSAWIDLFMNDKTKDFAQKLYLYAAMTQNPSSTGIHDLISRAPAIVINSLYYEKKGIDGAVDIVDINKFYDDMSNNLPRAMTSDIREFVIAASAGGSEIIPTVGAIRRGEFVSQRSRNPVLSFNPFWSMYSANTPLVLAVPDSYVKSDVVDRADNESKQRSSLADISPAVKIYGKEGSTLVYNRLGSVWTQKEIKGKTKRQRYFIYVLDTQPIVQKIGDNTYINIDKDRVVFNTKNVLTPTQLLENISGRIPGSYSFTYAPEFKLRSDVVSESAVKTVDLLSDLQNMVDESSDSYIIVGEDVVSPNSIEGRAYEDMRSVVKKSNFVIIVRKSDAINQQIPENLFEEMSRISAKNMRIITSYADPILTKMASDFSRFSGESFVVGDSETGKLVTGKINPANISNQDVYNHFKEKLSNASEGDLFFGISKNALEKMSADELVSTLKIVEIQGSPDFIMGDVEWAMALEQIFNC